MKFLFPLLLCNLVFGIPLLSARTEYRLGGTDGNPWQTAVAEESNAGTYLVLNNQGQVERRVQVGISPFGAKTETLIDYNGTAILPFYIEPDINIALTDTGTPDNQIPVPYTNGKVSTPDGCRSQGFKREITKSMFDGNPASAQFHPVRASHLAGGGVAAVGSQAGSLVVPVIDFSGAIPINRVRFYPRLGQKDDLRLIEAFTKPRHPVGNFSLDSFARNFIAGYELRVGGNDLPFTTDACDDPTDGRRWVRRNDPLLNVIETTSENLDVVVDLQFPKQYVRWLYFLPKPVVSWEVAEFEVYGGGYIQEMVYVSQILDFGKRVNWGKIRWSGDFPPGTRMMIRTRTGNTPDPNLYFEKDANGNTIPTTKDAYEDVNYLIQLPTVYDAKNWSFWSTPYDIAAGTRDSTKAAASWQDGIPLVTLGSTQYLQLDIRLLSTFEKAPRLDQLAIQFSENPAAEEVVAEIWPIKVESFEPTAFTYVVKPTFTTENTGFDRLEILTHNRVDRIHSIKVDGIEVDTTRFQPQRLDTRLVVSFPTMVGTQNSLKRLEVVFEVPVLRFGTQFTGWVFASDDIDQIKQRIQPGNATFRFSGDILGVRSPVGGNLLVEVQASPRTFTPNGDGINDKLTLSYKLREVTAARKISLEIYDLNGRLVQVVVALPSTSGQFQHTWDGRDANNALVPPGTYLYRLGLDAEKNEEQVGVFAVAY